VRQVPSQPTDAATDATQPAQRPLTPTTVYKLDTDLVEEQGDASSLKLAGSHQPQPMALLGRQRTHQKLRALLFDPAAGPARPADALDDFHLNHRSLMYLWRIAHLAASALSLGFLSMICSQNTMA
jgi:hypothetical protein